MRAVVSGGAGFVGAHVVEALRARGHEPAVLDVRADPAADVRHELPVARALDGTAAAPAPAHGGPGPVVTGEYRPGDVRHVTAGSSRLRAELGWKPQVGFTEDMREFASAGVRRA